MKNKIIKDIEVPDGYRVFLTLQDFNGRWNEESDFGIIQSKKVRLKFVKSDEVVKKTHKQLEIEYLKRIKK